MKLRNAISLLLLIVPSLAVATPLFVRALPTGPNVNANAPGNDTPDENRSNIKWAPFGSGTIIGDDFQLPFDAVIDSITVWMVAEDPNTTDPSQELSSIRLFGGTDALLELKSDAYSFTPVTYDNGLSFWNASRGVYQPIFELTFSNLNWQVMAGLLYDFAVEGTTVDGGDFLLSLHASNACEFDPGFNACEGAPGLSETRQDAPDGALLEFETAGLDQYALLYAWYSHPGLQNLWDKSNDINVRLTSMAAVPEPSTFALLGLGFGALAYFRRRRG